MNPGIILCTRLNSRRIPEKPLVEIAGKPAIQLLVDRLLKKPVTPICMALAGNHEDEAIWETFADYEGYDSLYWFRGHPTNVLARMFWASEECGFDPIIRITHDDILQDTDLIAKMVDFHVQNSADYTYISNCVRGMDAEVISKRLLQDTWKEFRYLENTENLSYLFKSSRLNPKIQLFIPPEEYRSNISMSLDEPEDLVALKFLFSFVSPLASGKEITSVLNTYPEISSINHKPEVTIYTCAYNAAATLERAGKSVLNLGFKDFEYIILDDGSTDGTTKAMINLATKDKRVRLMRNTTNMGLASSCNITLDRIRSEFCLRLDADDELLPTALNEMPRLMRKDPLLTAIYPAYMRDGQIKQNTEHHVGGTLMRPRILRELRFCDGLRHWEGAELYGRIKDRYHILEYPEITWIYHRTEGSKSSEMTEKRVFQGELVNGCRQ